MIIKSFNAVLYSTFILLSICFSCEEHNVHGDTLAKGLWKLIEVQGLDSLTGKVYQQLPGAHLAFNICLGSMNDEWGSKDEKYGECSLVVNHQIDTKLTQDEYRFHIVNDELLKIKRLEEHSEMILPDLTGSYTYHIDGRNMVLKYQGTDRPALKNLEIHCWDWSPE